MEIKVEINGLTQAVQAELLNGQVWIHYAGRTFTVESASTKKSKHRKNVVGGTGQVLAPMPGKITKIFVSEEASIECGQPVVVMEAMKMEYTLKAEVSGQVEAIHCEVGEQVPLGKLLVKINSQ